MLRRQKKVENSFRGPLTHFVVARKYTSDEVYRANIITLCVTLAVAALLVILIGAIAGVAYNQIQKRKTHF